MDPFARLRCKACRRDGAGADCGHTSQKVSRASWKSYVTELRHSSFIPLIGGEMMNEMTADKVATASSENFAIGISKKSERQLDDDQGLYGTHHTCSS